MTESKPATTTLPDGRVLAHHEVGDTGGLPVVWCHGGLSSRLDVEFARAGAESAHVRLVTIDRPGLGESGRRKGRTVAEWATDVAAVTDALGIERFGVVGWSAGGPHALACAALLPTRVSAVATIGGMAPVRTRADRKELGLRADRVLVPVARHAGWLAAAIFHGASLLKGERAKRAAIRPFSDADKRVLEPLSADAVTAATTAAHAHGVGGLVDDYRAFGAPEWGFDLASITAPVRIWQGEADAAIPPSVGQKLADAIPGAHLQLVPDAGHFLVLEHGQQVFERLLTEGRG
jgi:pimeloyl-ACP methyl ester carboxylesterase